ncbi:MAG: DUF2505 domain-containing protein [Candidatus Schekmanbacteria bacterium]|nr:DUF2505 domain-containing protein [Candidatus Schekmanbacteria bacterium]
MDFEVEHRFSGPSERVIALFKDIEVQSRMHRDLGYAEWRELERQDRSGNLTRRIRAVPGVSVPSFVRRALGDSPGIRETQTWQTGEQRYIWEVCFDLSPRLRLDGTCRYEDVSAHVCRRRMEASIEVDIPLVGKRLEAFIKEMMMRSLNEEAAWIERELRGAE